MRAVTFQAPGEVRIDDVPEPRATRARRRDHPRPGERDRLRPPHLPRPVQIEPGFVIGHEFVGEVVAAGDDVTRVSVGDRILGTYAGVR